MKSYIERDSLEEKQLDKWFNSGLNLLLYGDHGCGKTTQIKEFWNERGIKYAMFSAASMDPWCDLIGIPKLAKKGSNSVIEYALPQNITEDIEAIFIDEYNRSPAAVRNAVLELVQFKSINGRKFPKLKVVWAAANPPDSDNNYDVEEIDPAQEDRFQIIVKLSGLPKKEYFVTKYGESVAKGAIEWYNNLAPEIRKMVSPRRLDYAVDYIVNMDGEARDVLPDERINVSLLTRNIRGNSKLSELLKIKASGDETKLAKFFESQANVQPCLKDILKDYSLSNDFLKYGDTEEVIALANAEESFAVLVYKDNNPNTKTALESYRKIHNKNPGWFDLANRTALASRAALDNFVEYRQVFSDTGLALRVSDISALLKSKTIEDIVDEVQCMSSPSIYSMDENSAANALKFFGRVDFKDFCNRNEGADSVKKAFAMIYSAFEFYYLRDATLIGASFDCKGCEKLAIAPPFAVQTALGGSGSRGNNGRVSVKETEL